MAALTFTTGAKNYLLDGLTGKGTNLYCALTQLRLFNAANAALCANLAVTWGTPVQGTASLITNSVTPTATDTCTKMEWWNAANASQAALGAASVSGGGGNIILGTTSFVTSTPVSIAATLRVPLNNGGTMRLNQALANQLAIAMTTATGAPSMANGGTMYFYDGTQPATADTALSGNNQLGTLTLALADYAAAAAGSAALAASKSVTPSATGTVSWCRWVKGSYILDLSVGTVGTDIIVDNTAWVSGTPRSMTGATLVMP